jgi:hypothetical protein
VLLVLAACLPVAGVLVSSSAAATKSSPFLVRAGVAKPVVAPGRFVRVTGHVLPRAPGRIVLLQVRGGGRWRFVASGSLSKRSTFSFGVRFPGVGGHFLRVVKPVAPKHRQGVSPVLEVIVSGRRTIKSSGAAIRVRLGAVMVSAPAGAIRSGQTLSLSVGAAGASGREPGLSVSGGPYRLSTSQGEPRKPVRVTLAYDPGLLSRGDKPLILHDSTIAHGWVPVATAINTSAHTVTATLGSFSLLDGIDDGTYYAGLLTGNRADLPDCKGSGPPPWVDQVTLPDSNQDPLPICFSEEGSSEAVLSMVNNRGFAQVITISGIKVDLSASHFSDTIDGTAAAVFARLDTANRPNTFVLGPGGSAQITIERPPPSLSALDVHIDPATHTGSAVGEMAWAFLTTAVDKLGAPLALANCAWSAVYNNLNAPTPGTLIDETNACTNAIVSQLGSKAAKDALTSLGQGLLVDDFFYKVIDAEGDALYPPQIGFTIPGSNPSYTDPSIHLGTAAYGAVTDGQTTTEQLTATGGQPPYRYYFYNLYPVPSWVTLTVNGQLTLNPPANDAGSYSFYVYVVDNTGQHSPFARDTVTFQTVPPPPPVPGSPYSTVTPVGPTSGPAGFESAVGIPDCPYPDPVSVLATSGGAGAWGQIGPTFFNVVIFQVLAPPGTYTMAVSCPAVGWTGTVSVTVTGPQLPVVLQSNTVAPGGTLTVLSGASGSPSPCPSLGFPVNSVQYGFSSNSPTLIPNPIVSWPDGGQSSYQLSVPPDAQPGTYYLFESCNYVLPMNLVFWYQYAYVPVTVT